MSIFLGTVVGWFASKLVYDLFLWILPQGPEHGTPGLLSVFHKWSVIALSMLLGAICGKIIGSRKMRAANRDQSSELLPMGRAANYAPAWLFSPPALDALERMSAYRMELLPYLRKLDPKMAIKERSSNPIDLQFRRLQKIVKDWAASQAEVAQ